MAVVDLDLQPDGDAIGLAGEKDDLRQRAEHRLGHRSTFALRAQGFALGTARRAHALGARRRGVRVQAIAAAVGGRHRDVDEPLGQRVERARRHGPLDLAPGGLQLRRVVGEGAPDVVYVIGAAGGADVVEQRARVRIGLVIGEQRHDSHGQASAWVTG